VEPVSTTLAALTDPQMHALAVLAAVLAYAVVQSVFGVGLLVFGTPTLLLLGYSFEEVLAYLLPCSIAISVLQVRDGGLSLEPVRRKFLLYTAPAVLAGTLVVLVVLTHKLDIRSVVGAMLILTATIRLLGPLRERMGHLIRKRLPGFLVLLGLVHGLSNLGGGLLTVIVSSLYHDKDTTRKHIAFGYGVMGAIQLATLLATTRVSWDWRLQLLLPLVAAATYVVIGRRVFEATRQGVYQVSLTALIAAFGLLLVLT
jgi:uncharacterized protein